MNKSKNEVPLLRKSPKESIYFDFDNKRLFIQEFTGKHEEYSKSLVWLLGMLGASLIIPFLSKKLEFMSIIPPSINYFLFSLVGYGTAKIVNLMIINKIKGERIYENFDAKQVKKILDNKDNLNIIWWTQLMLIIGYAIGFFICLLTESLAIDMAIIVTADCFVVILLQDSVRPFASKKAIRILKKQMKEGKFND